MNIILNLSAEIRFELFTLSLKHRYAAFQRVTQKNDCPLKLILQFCKNTAEMKLAIPQSFVIKICMHTLTHSLYICHKKYKRHPAKSGLTQRDCIFCGTVKQWVQQDRN